MIILKNISKSYEENKVLTDFSYEFKNGEKYCILGQSGCGKTTLVYIICGLVKPDCGSVEMLCEKSISVVFQEDRLCENVSVKSNLNMVNKKKIDDSVLKENLKQIGLDGLENEVVKNLSGGMKRRVAILRAIMHPFDLLIMDEPFKGLDVETKKQVISFVSKKTLDKTVIWITHDIKEVEMLKSRIITIL